MGATTADSRATDLMSLDEYRPLPVVEDEEKKKVNKEKKREENGRVEV